MMHGTYKGNKKQLIGEKALLRPGSKGKLLAQFDNLTLPQNFTHGWTAFPETDFEIDKDEQQ